MTRSNQSSLGEALQEYLGRNGLKRRIKQAEVVHDWADLVGERLAKVTDPVSVDATGTLWVRVHSAAWMQELHMMSRDIVRELGQKGRPVKQIRWLAGNAPVPGTPPTADRRARRGRSATT